MYYRQRVELMDIPLRGFFFFESEPKTKRFDSCPEVMSLPGARKQGTIVIVLGMQDLLPRSFWVEGGHQTLTGSLFQDGFGRGRGRMIRCEN